VRLLDRAEAEETHADLSDGTIVEDLMVNHLHGDDLANVGLLEQVLCLNHIVMESKVVNLEERSLDTHLRLTNALHQLDDRVDLGARVFHEVDALELSCTSLALSLNTRLDLGVS